MSHSQHAIQIYVTVTFTFSFSGQRNFFRAMLCIRAAYAVVRCPSVRCPSVCFPVTFVYSVEINKHIFKRFSLSDIQTMLVFSVPNILAIFRRRPPNEGIECAGRVGKNRDSRPMSGFIACCQRFDRQVLYTASPDRGKLVTIIVGKRRGWLFAGDETTTKCLW